MKDWKEYRLGEMIQCNPQVKLEKGKTYNLIDIDSIEIGSRYVKGKELTEYDGQSGCHFQNGDTVMARITPCLENGKIAQVQCESQKGFGSTELFVFRGTENKTDSDYVFNLMSMQFIRNLAANSMTGASGRQRADLGFIKRIKWNFPPLPTQQKIASILSAYDNLIQNYKKQIEALQTAASELYKEWFVRFRFPGYQTAKFENGIPEGWKVARVGDYVKIKSGFAFKSEWWQDEGCPVVKIKDIDNGEIVITDLDFVSEEHTKKAKSFLLNEGDLVIAMTGATIGKIGLAPKIKNLYTNQRVGKFFLPENPFETMPFLYCLFSQNSTVETILCLSGASSAQPNISPDQLESIKFFFNEDIVFQFNKKSAPFFRKILKLREQITNLTQQRDLLLPRFMSGKLEVLK